jgi:hypothetical protein
VINPGAPLVAITWMRTLDLPCDDIGDEVPADPTLWAEHGFLHVPTTVGGSPDVHLPWRQPVVQVDTYTNRPDSEHTPWNKAEHLAAAVLEAAQAQRSPVDLAMPDGFRPVRLHAVWAQSEPRRLPSDPAAYARVNVDYEMRWVVIG